jgi:hypothetical protein
VNGSHSNTLVRSKESSFWVCIRDYRVEETEVEADFSAESAIGLGLGLGVEDPTLLSELVL